MLRRGSGGVGGGFLASVAGNTLASVDAGGARAVATHAAQAARRPDLSLALPGPHAGARADRAAGSAARRSADRARNLLRPLSAVRPSGRDRRQVALPARHRQSAMAEIAARLPLAAPHARRRHRARRRQCARAGLGLDRDPRHPHFRHRLGPGGHGASASSPGCSIPRSCCRAPSSRSTAPS